MRLAFYSRSSKIARRTSRHVRRLLIPENLSMPDNGLWMCRRFADRMGFDKGNLAFFATRLLDCRSLREDLCKGFVE